MSSSFSNGFLVLRDLTVDALVLDGVEFPDPKSVDDTKYKGAFRGYFDVPPGKHKVTGRLSGKDHTTTVVVLPGWATVKRFDTEDGWKDDDTETELNYRRLAMSGSMQDAGALRPWPVPLEDADARKGHEFGDADFAWLRGTYADCAGANADSMAVQRYIDALRWHYILDSEMGAQAAYFGKLGQELAVQIRKRPALVATGAATYLDYFAEDLVDADKPETIEAGKALATALEEARKSSPPAAARAAAPAPAPAPAPDPGRSPLLAMAIAVAIVVGLVLLLRRSADTPPSTPTPSTASANNPATGSAPVVQLSAAKKQVSLFIVEAGIAQNKDLVDQATQLEAALTKDDCLAARTPYDALKEAKPDLTKQPALVLAQIRMLTNVGAYCNAWSDPTGTKHW